MEQFVKIEGYKRAGKIVREIDKDNYMVEFDLETVIVVKKSLVTLIKPNGRYKYINPKINIIRVEQRNQRLLKGFFQSEAKKLSENLIKESDNLKRLQALAKYEEDTNKASYGTAIAENMNNYINNIHQKEYYKELKKIYGVDLNILIENEQIEITVRQSVAESVARIKSIPSDFHTELRIAINENMGDDEKITSLIKSRYSKYTNRAEFIARDQSGTLMGRLQQARFESAGVEKAEWSSSGDSRVRQEHQENNGKTFEISEGIDGEIPGEPVNCRCTMKAKL